MPDTSAFNPMPPSPEPVPPASPEGAAPSLGEATVIRKPDAAPVHGDWSHLLRGQRLGQFVIEEPLGAGGMAAVLRARDTQLDRLVALKILPPDLARDPDNVRRFHNEARAAARLDSPYIARVYASGTDLDLHYIAYEFVEGESLRNRIERERKLPPAEVVRLGWQMAQALAHAVERGVVHRDVKPANIVMGVRGEAKLVDMGLARAQVEANQAELTQSGVTLGTFDYLAPEQALDPRQADVRSDIYSLGCTLYHAITGQPPVPGGTAARKLQAHQQELPLDPRQLNASVGDGLAALLARMMAKDPALRFSSPAELAQHFRMLMPPEATGATPLPELERQLLAALQPPRRSDAVWPLVGAAVLLLALTFVILPWLPGLGPGMPWAPDPPRLAQASPPLPPLSPVPTTTPEVSPGPTLPASPAEPALPMVREVTTGSDLRTALEQRAQGVLTLAGDGFELNLGESEPLVLAQCDWTLQAPPGKRPVLRLVLRSTAWLGSDGRLQPGLTVRRGRLVLRGLRVEVVAPPDAPDWTAFHAHGGVLQFVDCELVTLPTHRLAPMDGWVTLVQATTDRSLPLPFVATVDVQQSLLYGGVEGFWMDAGTQLTLRDCVVGPFERTIRIRQTEATAGRPNTVEMTRVTWLLGAGPGLVADLKLPLRWRLTESVIVGPPRDGEAPGPPLLLVGADQLRLVEWRSQANSFHQLDALIAQGQGEDRARVVAATVQNLSAAPPGIQDDDSRQDRVLPFAHDQVWDQLRRLEPAAALEAVRLNPKLASVRQGPRELRGARQLLGAPLHATIEPLVEEPARPVVAESSELVVDGIGQSPGTYATLAGAVASLGPTAEATIVVRQQGQLSSRPIDVGARRLTIRGASNAEIQALPPMGADTEAALFFVAGGHLSLENLALRSATRGRDDGRRQGLIHLAGQGRCRLRSCQVTLLGDGSFMPTLVTLGDGQGMVEASPMPLPAPEPLAVELEGCFIRGQGHGLESAAAQSFQLEVRQTAVALRGVFCRLEGPPSEVAPMLTETAAVSFEQSTIVAMDGLFSISYRPPAAPPPTLRVLHAGQNLLAAAEGTALVRVEGVASEADLRRRFSWQGKRNLYGSAGPLLSWSMAGDLSPPRQYEGEAWVELWGRAEDEPRFVRGLRFSGRLDLMTRFQGLVPRDLRITVPAPLDPDLLGRGADLDRVYRQERESFGDINP